MNKDKWIIGLDLDGTSIIDHELNKVKYTEDGRRVNETHPKTFEAIKKLQELGHTVVIDTGRIWYSAEEAYKALGLNSYVILNTGARIYHPITGEDNYYEIPATVLNDIVNEDVLKNRIVHMISENKDRMTIVDVAKTRPEVLEKLNSWWKVDQYEAGHPISDTTGFRVTVDMSYEEVQEALEYLKPKYSEYIDFTNWQGYKETGIFGITMNNAKWSKGLSLLHLADKLGIPRENTMGFGDDENDITMFEKVKVSVSMINAKDKIKEFTTHTTELSNNDGGVGEFLIKWFNL